jgi:ADP-ribosylglycohydrolase
MKLKGTAAIFMPLCIAAFASIGALPASAQQVRRISYSDYRDKVYGAWLGQVTGAAYGFPFEGKARNAIQLDHTLRVWNDAVVDDDYYYEMVALYGFERFGIGMTVEQLGTMWKEYKAGTWGSSEQARFALERGIKAPDSGSPRYNRWFHTIGSQFSSDIYGMISPGMVNLAGAVARNYSHVNGYAEGSDGAVFVAACISEAFFETNPMKIVRQAAQLIDPRSNYRKAIDFVLHSYEQGKPWREVAAESEARWRPDYPQLNNSVANGALVALGILYGDGDYMKSINIVTQTGDFTDADCNAANVSSVVGAMRGSKALPTRLTDQFHDRIYGDHMGPLKFGRVIDEKISNLADRIATVGEKNLLANGARREGDTLVIPVQTAKTQPLEYFDINDYGSLWNPDWKLSGAARGGAGATYVMDDVLVTFPRDTRPCLLERTVAITASNAKLYFDAGAVGGRPWRLQVMADDDIALNQGIGSSGGTPVAHIPGAIEEKDPQPEWTPVTVDLSAYKGRTIVLRLYQWPSASQIPGPAYWRRARLE